MLVLWGERSIIAQLYDVMKMWREQASQVSGKALASGHHLAEEVPQQTLAEISAFLRA